MLKWIGAAIILGAATWSGFEFSRHLSERPKQLRMFRDSLQTLDAEIMYSHTPLKEASIKISSQLPKPISSFYDTFSKKLDAEETTVKVAWEESMEHIWSSTALKDNEYEILSQFGENLGKHDRHTQQKQIMLALSHLEREEASALEKQKHYENMVKSLGFLGGVLFIILLL